jgi:hypothetical protein
LLSCLLNWEKINPMFKPNHRREEAGQPGAEIGWWLSMWIMSSGSNAKLFLQEFPDYIIFPVHIVPNTYQTREMIEFH